MLYIGQITHHVLKNTDKKEYVLCPISLAHIKVVSRNLYKTVVTNHMSVVDIDGNNQDIIFDKNIIHFQLMPLKTAKKIYRTIIAENEGQYNKLLEWINNEL